MQLQENRYTYQLYQDWIFQLQLQLQICYKMLTIVINYIHKLQLQQH